MPYPRKALQLSAVASAVLRAKLSLQCFAIFASGRDISSLSLAHHAAQADKYEARAEAERPRGGFGRRHHIDGHAAEIAAARARSIAYRVRVVGPRESRHLNAGRAQIELRQRDAVIAAALRGRYLEAGTVRVQFVDRDDETVGVVPAGIVRQGHVEAQRAPGE